jgi:serine/threonine protein kinase
VTEYAENGSLYGQLHNEGSTTQQISLEQTIKWAKQIARGIAYLHYEAIFIREGIKPIRL